MVVLIIIITISISRAKSSLGKKVVELIWEEKLVTINKYAIFKSKQPRLWLSLSASQLVSQSRTVTKWKGGIRSDGIFIHRITNSWIPLQKELFLSVSTQTASQPARIAGHQSCVLFSFLFFLCLIRWFWMPWQDKVDEATSSLLFICYSFQLAAQPLRS